MQQLNPAVVFGPDDEATHFRKLAESKVEELAAQAKVIEALRAKVTDLEKRVVCFQNVGPQLQFLTGLSREYWDILWNDLQPLSGNIISQKSAKKEAEGRLNCPGAGRKAVLSPEDELLMTLMRLRLGRLEEDLAFVFGVDTATVSRIFTKWINFLFLRLGDLPIWPPVATVQEHMPSFFKEAYPSTYAIIDATELKCETPSSLPLQSQLYSSYKSHTTKKGLVAIAPNGAFVFVSELYTGSISARELTKRSGFLKLASTLPAGTSLMADRGFDIQDMLAPYGVLLNIPPFRQSASSHLPQEDVIATQKIARVRIHVERAIAQVKRRFHILDRVIPLTLVGSINQIWSVCCMLANFAGPLTSEVGDDDESLAD